MWLVNLLIPDLVANDSIHLRSIFLPNDCAFSKIGLLRLQLEKDEPLNIGEFNLCLERLTPIISFDSISLSVSILSISIIKLIVANVHKKVKFGFKTYPYEKIRFDHRPYL